MRAWDAKLGKPWEKEIAPQNGVIVWHNRGNEVGEAVSDRLAIAGRGGQAVGAHGKT